MLVNILPKETINLQPGFKTKHTMIVDLNQPVFKEFVETLAKDTINFMRESAGQYGDVSDGQYLLRVKPVEVEILVK